jgi:hypothetical protein
VAELYREVPRCYSLHFRDNGEQNQAKLQVDSGWPMV